MQGRTQMKRRMVVWLLAAVACVAPGWCGAESLSPVVDGLLGALSLTHGCVDPGVRLSMWPLMDTVHESILGIGIPWGRYEVVGGVALALVGNTVEEEAYGFLVAPVANVAEGICGVEVAAGMNYAGACYGFQVAAGLNFASDFGGAQVAAVNFTDERLYGLQAGAYNQAGDMRGGVQMGLFNRARTMRGGQVGAVNLAATVKGVQIGLVNVATEHEWGWLPLARVAF